MEIKENTKVNWFTKFFINNFTILGIILSAFTFLGSNVLYWALHKMSFDTMMLFQIVAVAMILFFLLLDIQNKLDSIEKKIDNK
jgi:hypothetical protein